MGPQPITAERRISASRKMVGGRHRAQPDHRASAPSWRAGGKPRKQRPLHGGVEQRLRHLSSGDASQACPTPIVLSVNTRSIAAFRIF